MSLSPEMRRLQNKWATNTGWPKRLEWLEIDGIHGWTGQRIDFSFPIVALVGENGAGKSTVLQAAASIYADASREREIYPSTFFPDTPWERITAGSIKYSVREGNRSRTDSVRKLTRWRGYSNRPQRNIVNIDLSRLQPVAARVGYQRLANPQLREVEVQDTWAADKVRRLSHLLGKSYESARMALTTLDNRRRVPVLQINGQSISGFHQGAGEITIAELLQHPFPSTALVLIDEIETSLHPRAQRRLVRELADQCRQLDLQIILTTHSPYVLGELPPEARIQILNGTTGRTIVAGVSPEFAMTRMDEEQHPECDLYVEDDRAGAMLKEILVRGNPALVHRSMIIPYGAASVGYALGIMASQNRFPRPSCVFVDGDQEERPGCMVLPGGDAPERVVFEALSEADWPDLSTRLSRGFADVADSCHGAMASADHHTWVNTAANRLLVSSSVLWHAMCATWAANCLSDADAARILRVVEAKLEN
ncbi:AAA family ATPase [Cupriavidus gilardii]|uniref:AAA family ATPase n=1 Tax=Cupriavidus gilardii TaxID=82541 RepID=UPI001ABE41E1|nr:AAA family ATPase [Cupriavidus gilardii]MBO4120303.1 AAA family ATPase [Cupriavidus gilardii]